MACERGQATVEWVGLLLLVALVLGALLTLAPRVEGRTLGAQLLHRIACTARGSCSAGDQAQPSPGGFAQGIGQTRVRAVGARPPVPRDRAVTAFRVLRGVKKVAYRAWVLCLGWKRYQYELDHPEAIIPGRPMPVREALRIANACLNPLLFLTPEHGR